MTPNARERLAIALYAGCWRMYPAQGPPNAVTPEKAWEWLDESQREMWRHCADAAVEFFQAKPEDRQ